MSLAKRRNKAIAPYERMIPSRAGGQAQFVSFNLTNALICEVGSSTRQWLMPPDEVDNFLIEYFGSLPRDRVAGVGYDPFMLLHTCPVWAPIRAARLIRP